MAGCGLEKNGCQKSISLSQKRPRKKGLSDGWAIPFIFWKRVARLARFERATYGLEVRCSIQLSYRRINRLRYLTDITCFVHKKAEKRGFNGRVVFAHGIF